MFVFVQKSSKTDVNLDFFGTWFLPKRILEGMYPVKCDIFCLFFCLKVVYNYKSSLQTGSIINPVDTSTVL